MPRTKRLLVIGAETIVGREVLNGIHQYCSTHGRWEYHFESAGREERTWTTIRDWKPDGIIARISLGVDDELLHKTRLPVVNFNAVRHFDFPTVLADYETAGRMIARHFLGNGMRHFALASRTFELYAQRSCQGFVAALSAAGHSCEVFEDQFQGGQEAEWVANRRRMQEWLKRLKKPVALMCIHDFRAQEVCVACQRLGLRVPDDVAIVGMGNAEHICQLCTPPVSSVDVGFSHVGYEAARLLDRIIRGGKPPQKPLLVPPMQLRVRQSSDIVGVEDPEVAEAMRYIRNHAQEPITVKDLVNQVSMCRKTLETRFKKYLGRTPKAEITRVRVGKAQALLGTTELPVKAVAGQMNFITARKFSQFFHQKTGMTPTQYRRHQRAAGAFSGRATRGGV